jgi:hypothetical protein
MQMTVLWMGYIVSTRPFKDPWNNSQDFMNEMLYYICLDVSFSLTTVNSDEVSALQIGSVFKVLIISMLTLNCSIMLFD